MVRIERVSHPADGVDILPETREMSAPHSKGRHEKFQLGTNPMEMTPFEKSLVHKEAQARKDARHKYIEGIQGRDGGCRDLKYESEYEDGPEVN